ncbi:uncharacterized protein LOC136078351 isoform X1 [Hydra vulgaris]|uniref:Uncharacterized protein LOC136078351 isoform X1 n=1 Tax=Hydra vulgaris TaxID=6087 RepID=A0ABM4BLY7_HYDVU
MNASEIIKKNPSQRFKNTDCPFSLILKYCRYEKTKTILDLEWTHNHPINSFQSLSFKDIQTDILSSIYNLFENGYTPGLAYCEFYKKTKDMCKNEIEFHKFISDGSVFPRRTDYNFLYTDYHQSKYGSKDMNAMFEALCGLIERKAFKEADSIIKFQKFDAIENNLFILVIITSLMKRVHERNMLSMVKEFWVLV